MFMSKLKSLLLLGLFEFVSCFPVTSCFPVIGTIQEHAALTARAPGVNHWKVDFDRNFCFSGPADPSFEKMIDQSVR